jgi:hypothetical protein
MFNRCIFFVAIFFIRNNLHSQKKYFQQEVNYKINVTLNDTLHTLLAFEEIQYINNSTESLNYIYIHLWPNAYKNDATALAKQLLSHKKSDFYFSKPDERGFVDSLNFKVNNEKIAWEFDKEHIDICKLILNKPLNPSDTIKITTPFFVKIPDAKFSRLGHAEQAYFITQWYPKPAVFDNNGWHQMPYLDQGEFYSEFGSFDVEITLPSNYILAATGNRINAQEEEIFLNDKINQTKNKIESNDINSLDMSFPVSSKTYKTIRFKQSNIHDFAWFADKRFNVLKSKIELPVTKKEIDTWIFFTNKNFQLWKNAIKYVGDAVLFYSQLNGNYPYEHVTAVDGTIMAGGGMEYPNITVIGDVSNAFELEITIAHEVGHNWFYGILGSNERDFPFMDEGLNSFCEMLYIQQKHPEKKLSDLLGLDENFKLFGLNKIPYWREKETAYFMSAKSGADQPLDLPSQKFSEFNYGSIVYSKTPAILQYLKDYMGNENFDKAMKFYFDKFKFKHPSPSDFIETLKMFTDKNIDWFNEQLISTTHKIDYKISSLKKNKLGNYVLTLKNKTGLISPLKIDAFNNNKPSDHIWIEGFKRKKRIEFPSQNVNYFKIDGLDLMPDVNRKNNFINAKGLFKKAKPLQFNFITKFENPQVYQVNYLPLIAANYYNGFMAGINIHNYGLYQKRVEYSVTPFYAFKSNSATGFAELNYNCYPKRVFQQITYGVKLKSFMYDYYDTETFNRLNGTDYKSLSFNYYKIAPFVQFNLKNNNANSKVNQIITYTSNNLFIDSLDKSYAVFYTASGPRLKKTTSFVNTLNYELNNNQLINPFKLNLELQHNLSMAKISATINYNLTISKKKFFDLRLFAGAFLAGAEIEKSYYAFRANGYNGYQDYLFASNFIARNESTGFGFNQFSDVDGALKTWTPLGQSSSWLAAINLKSPTIFKFPFKLFTDLSFCDARFLNTESFLWDAGINLTVIKEIIDIYIPIIYSNDIKRAIELNNISRINTIRFTINIHKLVLRNLIRDNLF